MQSVSCSFRIFTKQARKTAQCLVKSKGTTKIAEVTGFEKWIWVSFLLVSEKKTEGLQLKVAFKAYQT